MRGESHFSISVLISVPTWYMIYKLDPLPLWRSGFVLILFGMALGSLLPDIDASDAKVMHGIWSPIGRVTKKFFYKPLTKTDLLEDEHRGFLHSLLGCLLIMLFFVPIVGALSIVVWLLSLLMILFPWPLLMYFLSWSLWWFWIGIPIGFLLHLVEDSFTKGGVRWFFPRGEPTHSTTRTNRGSEYLLVAIFTILVLVLLSIVQILPSSVIVTLTTFGVTLVSLIALYKINPTISRFGDKFYHRLMIEEYILARGGIRTNHDRLCTSSIIAENEEDIPVNPYIARVTNVAGKYGLEREFFESNYVEANQMKRGSVFEVRTFGSFGEKRVYYVVKNNLFCRFAEEMI